MVQRLTWRCHCRVCVAAGLSLAAPRTTERRRNKYAARGIQMLMAAAPADPRPDNYNRFVVANGRTDAPNEDDWQVINKVIAINSCFDYFSWAAGGLEVLEELAHHGLLERAVLKLQAPDMDA